MIYNYHDEVSLINLKHHIKSKNIKFIFSARFDLFFRTYTLLKYNGIFIKKMPMYLISEQVYFNVIINL